MAAYSGIWRQFAAKGGMGWASEPERARLKDVRTRPSNALSARLFFVAFCRNLRHTGYVCFPMNIGDWVTYARYRRR